MRATTGVRATLAIVVAIASAACALKATHPPKKAEPAGVPLSAGQASAVKDAVALMRKDDLTEYANLADELTAKGIWRLATPDDPYMRDAERSGDEPFAYTLSSGHQPSAIIIAPRFFDPLYGPADRAALLVHEMGHYRAYVRTGRSTEYDGYKAEYDANAKLGLKDGLIYFAMLDGVEMYVVPIEPAYAKKADVAEYMKNPG